MGELVVWQRSIAKVKKPRTEDDYNTFKVVVVYDDVTGYVSSIEGRGDKGVLSGRRRKGLKVYIRDTVTNLRLASGTADSRADLALPGKGKRVRFNAESPSGRLDKDGNVRRVAVLMDPREWRLEFEETRDA